METFFGVLLIIFVCLLLFGRYIGGWIQSWMMGKMEDRFRRMMGMPTRKEERKNRRKQSRQKASEPPRPSRNPGSHGRHTPIIPKEYAEDVEFVEIKSYSEEVHVNHSSSSKDDIAVESQVEDVEFSEIRIDDRQ